MLRPAVRPVRLRLTCKEEKKMKYFVIAVRWDDEKKEQEKYIAGEFPNFVNAVLFRNAYNTAFSTTAEIREFRI